MQILHPFVGSVQQYFKEIAEPDRFRPDHCPQGEARRPLTAHGFYSRTLVDVDIDGSIRIRGCLCHACTRTVSLLPEFTLPYIRFGLTLISLFLIACLLLGRTLVAAAMVVGPCAMPYQRGLFWVRRFRNQAERLCAALAALMDPSSAPNLLSRALLMLPHAGSSKSRALQIRPAERTQFCRSQLSFNDLTALTPRLPVRQNPRAILKQEPCVGQVANLRGDSQIAARPKAGAPSPLFDSDMRHGLPSIPLLSTNP